MTNFTIVLSESEKKSRSFISKDGNRRALRSDELDEAFIAQAKYILVTEMDENTVAACKIARKNGVKVVVDADIYECRTIEHIELIDIFIASEFFYQDMYKKGTYQENCAEICRMGPEISIITLGARGCVGFFRGEYLELPAFTDIHVVDTTGAGDVFHGAFIYGLLQNWDGHRIAKFASAVSAIKCTRLGGRAGIPDVLTVERFINTGVIDENNLEKRSQMYRRGML